MVHASGIDMRRWDVPGKWSVLRAHLRCSSDIGRAGPQEDDRAATARERVASELPSDRSSASIIYTKNLQASNHLRGWQNQDKQREDPRVRRPSCPLTKEPREDKPQDNQDAQTEPS